MHLPMCLYLLGFPSKTCWRTQRLEKKLVTFFQVYNCIYFQVYIISRCIYFVLQVQLFITHGGAGSAQETICHKTPIVGIPINGDQVDKLEC